jgi:glycosyltransferase involved in cell wall biosynthesis
VLERQKALTVSIIIPVYNEEDYLPSCLDSIAAQSQMPDEVIVIDNNSNDNSVKIAKSYSFVTVLTEARQHQSFAQYKGFKNSKSDIIGRIDADTILPENWVENISNGFHSRPETIAITGGGKPYDFLLSQPATVVLDKFYILAYHLAGHSMMYGSNCAFRRSAFQSIKKDLNLRDDIWEDYDLAFCLGKYGKISKLNNIEVQTSLRAVYKPVLFQIAYQFRAVRTFWLHRGMLRAAIFMLAWSSLIALIPFVLFDKYVSSFLLWIKYIKPVPKVIPESKE